MLARKCKVCDGERSIFITALDTNSKSIYNYPVREIGKKVQQRTWKSLGVLLCVVGIGLIVKPDYDGYKAEKKQEENVQAIKKIEYQNQETKLVDGSRIVSPDLAAVAKVSLDEKQVIGRVAVPSISLELPILNGSSEKNLLSGAATIKGKQEMGKGNYALAGHNMSKTGVLFSDLSKLKKAMKYICTITQRNMSTV